MKKLFETREKARAAARKATAAGICYCSTTVTDTARPGLTGVALYSITGVRRMLTITEYAALCAA